MVRTTYSYHFHPEEFKQLMMKEFPQYTPTMDQENWNDFELMNAVIEKVDTQDPENPFVGTMVYFDLRNLEDEIVDGVRFLMLYGINSAVVALEDPWILSIDFSPTDHTLIDINSWETNQEPEALKRITDLMHKPW